MGRTEVRATERHGYAALLEASGDSPFVRHEVPESLGSTWWEADGAVAFRRRRHRDGRPGFVLLGRDDGIAQLLASLPRLGRPISAGPDGDAIGVSVPQHLEPLLHRHFRVGRGGDWEWFHTSTVTARAAGDEAVVPLDDVAREEEVAAFLARHSPTADTAPGRGERWFAIETAAGHLAAVAAYGTTATGAPHLSSIAVDSALRGQGLGRRIVSVVTRVAVMEHGVCTLGMYSHNTVARGLYLSLGYANPHAWSSRTVTPR
jgi:ribosomal protein S18 acetylase RimI-like enzyme